jgi:hypothetical protein
MIDIIKLKNDLLKKLNGLSKVKKDDLEWVILKDFGKSNKEDFILFLKGRLAKINNIDDLDWIEYYTIFWDEKVLELLENPSFETKIKEYKEEYEKILSEFSFYSKWNFTPYKASALLKSVKEQNLYWWNGNAICLAGTTFWTYDGVNKAIEDSYKRLGASKELSEIKGKILSWTKAVKTFHDLLETKWDKFISKLLDLDNFKKELWDFYFKKLENEIKGLISSYETWVKEIEEITKKAIDEKWEWDKVVEIFKKRFYFPFEIDIEDKANVVLWVKEPEIEFKCLNEVTSKYETFTKPDLLWLDILSWWEQRALYLLYVLFDIETKIKNWNETLLIIDDIADSFDYKNKYAIIEYLLEISENPNFKMIILTHNFDFYRSIQSRLWIKKWDKLTNTANLSVICNKDRVIEFENGTPYFNPVKNFRKEALKDNYKLIALAPFTRNLAEYLSWQKDCTDDKWTTYNHYRYLTNVLHSKNTKVTIEDLCKIIESYFSKINLTTKYSSDFTKDFIIQLCNDLVSTHSWESIDLEKKIVLSIWIRLKAELFMQDKLWELREYDRDQTRKLYNDCKKLGLWENEDIILKEVLLMTPETIHINSFMYEPIIDMSISGLIKLYENLTWL